MSHQPVYVCKCTKWKFKNSSEEDAQILNDLKEGYCIFMSVRIWRPLHVFDLYVIWSMSYNARIKAAKMDSMACRTT